MDVSEALEAGCSFDALESQPQTPEDDLDMSLADLAVYDTDGAKYRLGEAWAERPAVLVFLRHFG
jgi:hypothetical protein